MPVARICRAMAAARSSTREKASPPCSSGRNLVVKHKVTPVANDRQYQAAFEGGQLAMFITSSAALQPLYASVKTRFELGVAGYPLLASGGARRLPNSGAALMLYAPEGPRRDAALELLA